LINARSSKTAGKTTERAEGSGFVRAMKRTVTCDRGNGGEKDRLFFALDSPEEPESATCIPYVHTIHTLDERIAANVPT
jgi:hypothetical protein